ncbi:YkvA family protein [Humibacillus xanthopallidus]|uniref:Uncharacterized membrane protein YkvA (DUF1232 family) n=1 Tax=Humibacillus xanthopallidus TaxID=412689 RepID=A0A543HJL7_9MICO|nr:YkvA family protein [Humibacillus xanthopallidus]TQM58459.1 uncharacterized membrane protein YkvA (DUF1232 family) [Humibacillus xanthopallidus]
MKSASRIKLAATAASVVRASMRPGGPSVMERVHAVPRLVRATLDGTYAGTTVARLGLVAAAVAYVASPIDLLPEAFLPVVGAADDAVVIGWAIKAFIEETDRFVAWELGQGARRGQTVRGEATWSTPAGGGWEGGASDGAAPRADRDTTGAAAPRADEDRTGAAAPGAARATQGKVVLPEGVRQAATDYVMETVRKRLER